MKKVLKIILGLAMLTVVALSCVACSVSTWVDQMICEHEFDDGVVTKVATCSEFGELTKTCSLCEYVEVESIDLLAHELKVTPAVEPTCLKTGLTEGTQCLICDEVVVKQQTVPAKGHNVVVDDGLAPTCLSAGYTEGSHCSRCNKIINKQAILQPLGHKLVSYEAVQASCFVAGHSAYSECTVCKVKYGYEEYTASHKMNALGICVNCGFASESAYTLENFNNEEFYTKTELKVGDVIELDKVFIYSVVSNITFKTSDGFVFTCTEFCVGNDEGGCSGHGITPSKAEFVYKTFDNEASDSCDFVLRIPANSHLVYEDGIDEAYCFDYQFTDMTVTIVDISLYEEGVSAAYVFTDVV